MFSLYASLFCLMALMLVQRESVPLVFLLSKLVLLMVCTRESVPLVFLLSKLVLLMACTRESVPFAFCSASLSSFLFGQGTLFPFPCIAGLQLLFDLYNSYI
jgi:hypothetical protein